MDDAIYQAGKALHALLEGGVDLSSDDKGSIRKAIQAVEAYPTPVLDGLISITVSTSYREGGSGHATIEISDEGMQLNSGGSVYDPAVGSDAYSKIDFAHDLETDSTEGDGMLDRWENVWYAHLPNTARHEDDNQPEVRIEDDSSWHDEA